MSIPLVSVIMPTYNCCKYIADSINSVINQTIPDWEIQIVDDCSTDNTEEIVRPFLEKHPNIHYFRFSQNCGVAVARTESIKLATGKYCAFLDSDDIWAPEKLEKQISFMEQMDAKFSCTAYRQIDIYGNELGKMIYPPQKTDYRKCILLSDPIGNLTVMYDQDALGKFTVPPIRKRNDFALWLQILKKTDYCYGMADVLGSYRVGRRDSVSYNKIANTKFHWKLYHEIEKHNPLQSLFEIGCWAFVKGTGIGLNKKVIRR